MPWTVHQGRNMGESDRRGLKSHGSGFLSTSESKLIKWADRVDTTWTIPSIPGPLVLSQAV
jgi:hypothetical protein